jgi:hypothetical protein
MDLLKAEPDSCMETPLKSSHAENQVINVKVECITDVEEEGDLMPTAFIGVKTEHEVSCVCVIVKHRSQISRAP